MSCWVISSLRVSKSLKLMRLMSLLESLGAMAGTVILQSCSCSCNHYQVQQIAGAAVTALCLGHCGSLKHTPGTVVQVLNPSRDEDRHLPDELFGL